VTGVPEHLLFQLHGPLVSWGTPAVGQERPSTTRPTKSASLGLVAAALGLKRSETSKQRSLATDYGFGVRVDSSGSQVQDFQTAQVPRGTPEDAWQTRKDEVRALDEDDDPITSWRDYRCDGAYVVALWPTADDPRFEPKELAQALEEPTFTVYLGRKACPPALPFAPEIQETGTLSQALERYPGPLEDLQALTEHDPSERIRADVYWDDHPESGFEHDRTETRRDEPIDTSRRTFRRREARHARMSLNLAEGT